MNKFLRYTAYTLIGLAALVIIFVIYFNTSYPDVNPPSDISVVSTPERISRGEYLANHVTVCMDCHSTRDWDLYSGPIVNGTFGKGGEEFNEKIGGVPGTIFSSNITPAGLRDYTDGELLRAMTCGVTKKGEAIFPLMPYLAYNRLTEEDAYSIIAYIRSLAPIENEVPESSLNFPVNFIVKTLPPKTFNPSPSPDRNNRVEYGKYLTTIAACADCHTPVENGQPNFEKIYGGGMEFHFPAGIVRSSNISPSKTTGIGNWTKDMFIERFKNFHPDSNSISRVDIRKEFNTPMPWTMYAGMEEGDLGAIYSYLMTQEPVENRITLFTPRK